VFSNEPEPLTEKRTSALSGIGLRNVYERLRLVYPAEKVDFAIDSGENEGTVIRLMIPLREEETPYV
jgi:two-component system sensor histidine kinase YesM